MNPVRRTVLEQKAKQIEKLKSLKWSKALDEAAREYGFSNLRHYQNVIKELARKKELEKPVIDFNRFSELLASLKKLSPSDLNEACNKRGLNVHVKNYLLDLSRKGYLNPGGYLPNSAQKLELEFYDFDFSVGENDIEITGKFLIQIKSTLNVGHEYMSSVKRSDRFDGKFLAYLDSNELLSLRDVEISDKVFWEEQ